MDSLFSFPVGLFHPLQHAGSSRRSPIKPSSRRNPSKPSCTCHMPHSRGERRIDGYSAAVRDDRGTDAETNDPIDYSPFRSVDASNAAKPMTAAT